MSEEYGSDFITIVDDDGAEFELEVLDTMDYKGQLLIETDDSDTPITTVASLVAQTLHLTVDEITSTATRNAQLLLMNRHSH